MNLLPGKNGNAVDSTGSGVVRLRVLAHAGWIDAQVEGTMLKLRLGAHAKRSERERRRLRFEPPAWLLSGSGIGGSPRLRWSCSATGQTAPTSIASASGSSGDGGGMRLPAIFPSAVFAANGLDRDVQPP